MRTLQHRKLMAAIVVSTVLATTIGVAAPSALGAQKPIKIGMIHPLNAPAVSSPENVAALRAAVRGVNARGGINGRTVELDWCEEGNDANKATQCARQLRTDGVIATVGDNVLFAGADVNTIFKRAGIAQVAAGGLTSAEQNATNAFIGRATTALAVPAMLTFVRSLGIDSVHFVANNVATASFIVATYRKAVAKSGMKNTGETLIPAAGIGDYSPYAQSVLRGNPGFTIMVLGRPQLLGMARAIRGLGSSMPMGGASVLYESDMVNEPNVLNGFYMTSATPWIHDAQRFPKLQDYIKDMRAEQQSGDGAATLTKQTTNAIAIWGAAQATFQVIKSMMDKGTPLTAPKFQEAFRAAKSLDTGVLAQPWTPGDHLPISGYDSVSQAKMYVNFFNGKKEMVLARKTPVDGVPLMLGN